MSRDGHVTAYTYNGLNQLTEAETEDAIIKYTYDGRGNQIEEYNETEGITAAHTYAVTGEMTGLTVTSGDTTTLTQEKQYNHEGIRISKTEGGVTRRYYYDNGILAYTKDGATVSSANILSGDGDILGSYRGEDYHVYTKDVQNSTESILKEDGSLAAAYCYSDFGETEELTESSFDNEICYTGAVYDVQSDLYYMNARYYDPANGRFISQDTYRGELEDADQWHLYAYCANNPINYVDPSGHWVISVGLKFEAAFVVGGFFVLGINRSKNSGSLTRTLGGKITTSAFASASVFASYYPRKSLSDLKGWGFTAGISFSCGIHVSGGVFVDVSSKGLVAGGSGSIGGAIGLSIPYWDLELGYTTQIDSWNNEKASSKEKTIKVSGITVKRKKCKEYVRVRVPKRGIQVNIYRNKKKVRVKKC